MTVSSLLINQGDELEEKEQALVVQDFLTSQISFPPYIFQGEINGKKYDFQLIFDKKSPILNNLELIEG